jgi:hypothetical protein
VARSAAGDLFPDDPSSTEPLVFRDSRMGLSTFLLLAGIAFAVAAATSSVNAVNVGCCQKKKKNQQEELEIRVYRISPK